MFFPTLPALVGRSVRPGRGLLTTPLGPSFVGLSRREFRSSLPISKSPETITSNKAVLTQVTTLPNGIRVATQTTPGYFCGFGAYLDVGSRYETDRTRGCTYLLDRLAFKSTQSLSSEAIGEQLESMGGNIQRASARENIMYQASVFQNDLPRVAALFAEVIRKPRLLPEELEEQQQIVRWELAEMETKPELYLPEVLHQTAYPNNTLGNPLVCSEETLVGLTPERLRAFMGEWFTADRLVISAIGAPHDTVCELVRQHYGDMAPHPAFTGHPTVDLKREPLSVPRDFDAEVTEATARLAAVVTAKSAANTTTTATLATADSSSGSAGDGFFGTITQTASKLLGGSPGERDAAGAMLDPAVIDRLDVQTLAALPAVYRGGCDLREINGSAQTHMYLGFLAPGMDHQAIYALAVLQILLGGGDSFSAGGPGKGMYSKLYTQVLNRYIFVESCSAFTFSYHDSTLFGISAICEGATAGPMFEVIIRQLVSLLPRLPSPPVPTSSVTALAASTGSDDTYAYYPHPDLVRAEPAVRAAYANTCLGLNDVDVARAKNQLKSSLMMNLESRPIQLEDLGRQIQQHNVALTPEAMCRAIDAVSKEDLYRLVQYVLGSNPTVVAAGDVRTLRQNISSTLAAYGLRRDF
ncbi:Mitochondrial-processing peptidase subunit alpha [Tieghemiomyces parasiticus]|uniref:Mitochondrial-processing peptidase subunit alpha n=1 Tax=Tieghemiomyces parasiticus TaxID=78921 RepID=A0A9W7ZLW3_9FUNG|nr:Mitochondrial-processing peptidase subunit alpha [Tieghemiomyces parasiticus]